MKKYLTILLTIGMLISLLLGCTPAETTPETDRTESTSHCTWSFWYGETDGKTPVKLYVYGPKSMEKAYGIICDNANQKFGPNGLTVEFVPYDDKSADSTVPDHYLQDGTNIDVLISTGTLESLKEKGQTGLLTDMSADLSVDLSEALGAAMAKVMTGENGTVYGVPVSFTNSATMLVNVDLFTAAGVEVPYDGWTYSEFLTACEKLEKSQKTDNIYGVCWNGLDITMAQNYIQAAASVRDDEIDFGDAIWIQGLETIKTTMDKGWACDYGTCKAEEHGIAGFLRGESAMLADGSQLSLCMDKVRYPHDFVTAVVPCPVPDGTLSAVESMVHMMEPGNFASVAAGSTHKKHGMYFISWLLQEGMYPVIQAGQYPIWMQTDVEQMLKTVEAQGMDPALLDSCSIEKLYESERSEWIEHGTLPGNATVKKILKQAWEGYLASGEDQVFETAKDAMQWAEKQARAAQSS